MHSDGIKLSDFKENGGENLVARWHRRLVGNQVWMKNYALAAIAAGLFIVISILDALFSSWIFSFSEIPMFLVYGLTMAVRIQLASLPFLIAVRDLSGSGFPEIKTTILTPREIFTPMLKWVHVYALVPVTILMMIAVEGYYLFDLSGPSGSEFTFMGILWIMLGQAVLFWTLAYFALVKHMSRTK